jgi:hypothetical protein
VQVFKSGGERSEGALCAQKLRANGRVAPRTALRSAHKDENFRASFRAILAFSTLFAIVYSNNYIFYAHLQSTRLPL